MLAILCAWSRTPKSAPARHRKTESASTESESLPSLWATPNTRLDRSEAPLFCPQPATLAGRIADFPWRASQKTAPRRRFAKTSKNRCNPCRRYRWIRTLTPTCPTTSNRPCWTGKRIRRLAPVHASRVGHGF